MARRLSAQARRRGGKKNADATRGFRSSRYARSFVPWRERGTRLFRRCSTRRTGTPSGRGLCTTGTGPKAADPATRRRRRRCRRRRAPDESVQGHGRQHRALRRLAPRAVAAERPRRVPSRASSARWWRAPGSKCAPAARRASYSTRRRRSPARAFAGVAPEHAPAFLETLAARNVGAALGGFLEKETKAALLEFRASGETRRDDRRVKPYAY